MSMNLRKNLSLAALAALTLTACGPSRPVPDGGTNNPPTGCVGVCNDGGRDDAGQPTSDAGQSDGGQGDGGTMASRCQGFVPDGGTTVMSIQQVRDEACFRQSVTVEDVVVHTVDRTILSNQGNGEYRAFFWVSDPASPKDGIFVEKFYSDPPGTYLPKPGDVVTIQGVFQSKPPFEDRTGYQRLLANEFSFTRNSAGLTITVTDAGEAPAPVVVAEGFGDAQEGFARPNSDYAGALVKIPGPVEITDPTPTAFKRVSAVPDDDRYYGFEVSGGVLVNNHKTFDQHFSDGGVNVRCDWRIIALDAGMHGQKVVFPDGISGVWESYTHAPCADGGTASGCFRLTGKVPGTYDPETYDGGNAFTFVLYPQSCDQLQGTVVDAP
jgi:hypothetical protein